MFADPQPPEAVNLAINEVNNVVVDHMAVDSEPLVESGKAVDSTAGSAGEIQTQNTDAIPTQSTDVVPTQTTSNTEAGICEKVLEILESLDM